MDHTLGVDPDIRILEGVDWLPTFDAAREEGVDRTRYGLEERVGVAHVCTW